jgi:hypothetical protein
MNHQHPFKWRHVDHTTIYRWVQQYAPELDKRCWPHLGSLQRFLESG